MPLIKDKYDCGIKNNKGDFIGLMLTRDNNGIPRYQQTTDPAIASQYFTGLAGYSNFEPQKQLQVGQTDWRGGFGQEYYDYNDEQRYYYTKNVDARFKGMIICAPKFTAVTVPNGEAVTCMCDFNGTQYFAAGTVLYKYTTSGLVAVQTFAAAITDLEPFSDDYLYIALGDSEKYNWMYTDETGAASTESDGYATYFKRVGDTLWKATLPNELQSSTAPHGESGTDWTTVTYVDTTYFDITDLLEERGILYIMKEDQPYYMDDSGSPQPLIPELRSEQTDTSGHNAITWQGRVYIPCGAQTLYEYDNGVITNISPSRYITNNTDFGGRVQALAQDAHYLFAVVDNDTKVEILAGRWETVVNETKWVWHPISELTMTGAASAWVTTALNRRLWIGNATAGDPLYWVAIPRNYSDVTASNYLMDDGGEFITAWHHANFKADAKAWYKLSLTMSGTDNDMYWKAYYQKLGDTDWTEINDVDKFKVSPVTTAYIPADADGVEPSSSMIRFKFTPIAPDSTYWVLGDSILGTSTYLAYFSRTPVLISYDVRAVWYPPVITFVMCQIKVGSNLLLNNGLCDEMQTKKDIMDTIEELKDPTLCWFRAFYPPYWETEDDTLYVKLLAPVDLTMIKDEKTGDLEWVYDLQLEVIKGVTF